MDINTKDFIKGHVVLLFVIFCIGVTIYATIKQCTNKEVPKQEVDNIEQTNDSIKYKVKQLDSIKNAKVIEVEVLDNDSTVKLFYQLIK